MTQTEPTIDTAFEGLRRAHHSERAPQALRRRALERARDLDVQRKRQRTRPGKWLAGFGVLGAAAGFASLLWLGAARLGAGGTREAPRSAWVPSPEPAGSPGVPTRPCAKPLPSADWDPAPELPPGLGFEAGVLQLPTECGPLRRRYLVRMPAGDASSAPVLIVVHDGGQKAELAAIHTRWWFEDLAQRERAILVYANGTPAVGTNAVSADPNAGVWQTDGLAHPAVDDAEYLASIVADLRGRRRLAPGGDVFLAGYGTGAVMALTAAARHPEHYSGVAAFLPTRSPGPNELGARAGAERRLRSVFIALPAASAAAREDRSSLVAPWAAAFGGEPGRSRVTRREGIERVDASLAGGVTLRILRLSTNVDPFPLPGGGDPITRAASEAKPFFFDGPGAAWSFFRR